MIKKDNGIVVPKGKRGEITKVTEEYFKLRKVANQKNWSATIIEAADLTLAIAGFIWNKCYIPFFLLWPFAILRWFYKQLAYCVKVFLSYPNGGRDE